MPDLNPSSSKNELDGFLPDVAQDQRPGIEGTIDWVGMEAVELPLEINISGNTMRTAAMADVFVSLDKADEKGIHMSRLYLSLMQGFAGVEFSWDRMVQVVDQILNSHKGLSEEARLELSFDAMLLRPALLSDNKGWRRYPVRMHISKKGEIRIFELEVEVVYSSTCPCSSALAKQLNVDAMMERFSGQKTVTLDEVKYWMLKDAVPATPHAQRSRAKIRLRTRDSKDLPSVQALIDASEDALKTPVQAAVKREDEQEFARRNGQNLMFCEDAARKLKALLEQNHALDDYLVEVRHMESLHPHDAVAILTKKGFCRH